MKSIVLTMIAVFAAAVAQAETAGGAFDGPFVSAQFGSQSASAVETHVQTTLQPGPSFDQPDALGKGGVLQFHGGYGRDLGGMFNVAVGAFAEFGGAGVAPTRATFFGDTVEQDITNRVGIYVAPGVYVDPQTVIFAKIGVSQADHRYDRAAPGIALSQRISGQMLGVGVKRMLDEHMFWTMDYTRVDYGLAQIGAAVSLNGNTVDI
jgi:hypothetical protein